MYNKYSVAFTFPASTRIRCVLRPSSFKANRVNTSIYLASTYLFTINGKAINAHTYRHTTNIVSIQHHFYFQKEVDAQTSFFNLKNTSTKNSWKLNVCFVAWFRKLCICSGLRLEVCADVKAVVVSVRSALRPAASSIRFQPAVYVLSAELRRAVVQMGCERGAWASPACLQLWKHRHLTFISVWYCRPTIVTFFNFCSKQTKLRCRMKSWQIGKVNVWLANRLWITIWLVRGAATLSWNHNQEVQEHNCKVRWIWNTNAISNIIREIWKSICDVSILNKFNIFSLEGARVRAASS